MENFLVATVPLPSSATHFTVVTPIGKVLPEGGVHTTGRFPAQASSALAWKVTVAPAALVATAVMCDGRDSTGFDVSRTVNIAGGALVTEPQTSLTTTV